MGDTICSGLFYLCSCCCFGSPTDPGSDGSGYCDCLRRRGRKKDRDPREKALKREFMARDYRRDSVTGRIVVEQPPGPVMQMVSAPVPEALTTSSISTPAPTDNAKVVQKQPLANAIESPSRKGGT